MDNATKKPAALERGETASNVVRKLVEYAEQDWLSEFDELLADSGIPETGDEEEPQSQLYMHFNAFGSPYQRNGKYSSNSNRGLEEQLEQELLKLGYIYE